jgi:hypothetical protein
MSLTASGAMKFDVKGVFVRGVQSFADDGDFYVKAYIPPFTPFLFLF